MVVEALGAVSKLWWLSPGQRNPVVLHRHRDPATGQCIGDNGRRHHGRHVPVHRRSAVPQSHTVVQGWKRLWTAFRCQVLPGTDWAMFRVRRQRRWRTLPGFLFPARGCIFWVIGRSPPRLRMSWVAGPAVGDHHVVLAFWVAGQFFFERVYILLVFAGIWAMLQGVTGRDPRVPAQAVGRTHHLLSPCRRDPRRRRWSCWRATEPSWLSQLRPGDHALNVLFEDFAGRGVGTWSWPMYFRVPTSSCAVLRTARSRPRRQPAARHRGCTRCGRPASCPGPRWLRRPDPMPRPGTHRIP